MNSIIAKRTNPNVGLKPKASRTLDITSPVKVKYINYHNILLSSIFIGNIQAFYC